MKLTDIPVVFICPDHNEKYQARKLHMFTLLHKIGFKNVSMFKSETGQYPTNTTKAERDILLERLDDEPFILLEDDIELSEWADIDMEFEMPPDTDAFYLGYSRYGGSYTANNSNGIDSVEICHIDDTYIRILNMLSAHAIMFVSRKYKQTIADILTSYLQNDPYHYADILMARQHKQFNIYGYKYPIFYQSDNLGNPPNVKDATNFRF
jgi:hypothetical protein